MLAPTKISCDEWNKLVSETYGRPYNFQQQSGCRERGEFLLTVPCEFCEQGHESVPAEAYGYVRGVKFERWLERDPAAPVNPAQTDASLIRLFWWRVFYPDILAVANDLHRRGLLRAGNYEIGVDW